VRDDPEDVNLVGIYETTGELGFVANAAILERFLFPNAIDSRRSINKSI
jgi:hypothetical protein